MRRGPVYMVLASLLFTIMVGAVKVAREEMTAFEVILWRCATSLPLAYLLAKQARESVRVLTPRAMLLRALFGFGAMSCFFTAAKGLTLADLSILSKLQPIVVALAAPLALGVAERSTTRVWLVLGLGLAGCAMIIGPDLAVGSVYGLIALAASVLSAAAHIMVRKLGQTERPLAIVFWFQAITLVLALGAIAVTTAELPPIPPSHLWPWLAGIGVAATAGQVLMTRAYAIDRASVVAAASYAAPLWSVLGDLVAFGVMPTGWVIAGGLLVVGAGVILIFSRPTIPARVSSPPGHSDP